MSPFLEILIVLGALQGFIISAMLFFSKPAKLSSRLLASLIFFMALACLNLYITGTSWYGNSPLLIFLLNFIPMIIVMPMGPLIYFYARSFSDPNFTFRKKYRIHFLPVLIDLVPYLTAIIYVIGLIAKLFPKNDAPWGRFIDQYNTYSDIPRWLSVSIYLFATYKFLRSQQRPIRWLKQFVIIFSVFQAIWLCFLIPYVIPKYASHLMDIFNWYPVYIPISILIYWLGIKGYLASQNHSGLRNTKKSSSLDKIQGEEIIEKLKKVMEEEKPWMNPALNLSILTKQTGIPSKTISAVLNQYLDKSFNEFINEYRIAAIKARLLSAESRNLTIAGLAYECGFNSQPTFQRAFKSIEGESPSEFLLKHAEFDK
ncbi:MAG TPA: helix-turn-helix domain-containing protein [Puia sp.]|nr:helix-turn-helix domain-containing protein [Puia sp.]